MRNCVLWLGLFGILSVFGGCTPSTTSLNSLPSELAVAEDRLVGQWTDENEDMLEYVDMENSFFTIERVGNGLPRYHAKAVESSMAWVHDVTPSADLCAAAENEGVYLDELFDVARRVSITVYEILIYKVDDDLIAVATMVPQSPFESVAMAGGLLHRGHLFMLLEFEDSDDSFEVRAINEDWMDSAINMGLVPAAVLSNKHSGDSEVASREDSKESQEATASPGALHLFIREVLRDRDQSFGKSGENASLGDSKTAYVITASPAALHLFIREALRDRDQSFGKPGSGTVYRRYRPGTPGDHVINAENRED